MSTETDCKKEQGSRRSVEDQDQSLLLTVVQAAEILSVGRSTVYELLYAKQLPSVKIGNCRRIKRSDLEAYVRDLCEPS
jgi:excisionase family DNA binding protein